MALGVRVVDWAGNAPHLHEALPDPKSCASVVSASSAGSCVTPLCVPGGEMPSAERVIRKGHLGRVTAASFVICPCKFKVKNLSPRILFGVCPFYPGLQKIQQHKIVGFPRKKYADTDSCIFSSLTVLTLCYSVPIPGQITVSKPPWS